MAKSENAELNNNAKGDNVEAGDEKGQPVSLHLPDELKAGAFANNAFVEFNVEQFNVDFFNLARMANTVVGRVAMTPMGFKRFTLLCVQQLQKYEADNGIVGQVASPDTKAEPPAKKEK